MADFKSHVSHHLNSPIQTRKGRTQENRISYQIRIVEISYELVFNIKINGYISLHRPTSLHSQDTGTHSVSGSDTDALTMEPL